MMTILERQSLLSGGIAASQSRPQWLQSVANVAREFDFSHATLMKAPELTDEHLASVILETTVPLRFIKDFDQQKFLPHCPVLTRVASSLMPQCWSLDDDNSAHPYPVPMERMMRRAGLANGVMIPINSLHGERYILRFDGKCPQPDQIALNEIGMIALHAFDVYDRMHRAEMIIPKALTKRELEVLRWTSQGKTSAEIGQILTLSDHTINAYLNNAIKKLDCVNRTQLVAKAIRLKMIS